MNLTEKILLEYILFQHVESSNIDSIGYDEAEELLRIKFLSGAKYEYYDVPKTVYKQFMRARSKGRFAHRNIYPDYAYQNLQYLKKRTKSSDKSKKSSSKNTKNGKKQSDVDKKRQSAKTTSGKKETGKIKKPETVISRSKVVKRK